MFEDDYLRDLPESDPANAGVSLFICIAGFLGNLMAIFFILVLREYKKSVTHWYVLQLAIADSLFLLTVPFDVIENMHQGWIYSDWLCKAKETIRFLNYYASILFLVIMSIDRYLAVCHTLSSTVQKLRHHTSAFIITVSIWSAALLLCIPVMLYSNKSGLAPYCSCISEFPSPNTDLPRQQCKKEGLTSPEDMEWCLSVLVSTKYVKNIDEPHCYSVDLFNSNNQPQNEGSGFPNYSNLEYYDGFLEKSGMLESGDYSYSGLNNIVDESGSTSTNNTDQFDLIDHACHYWDHNDSWKIFLYFNFFVMFILPFFIILACYGLIIRRLSTAQMRTASSTSFSSQKKKSVSRSDRDRKRITIMCAALVSCFVVCWLPVHSIHLAKLVGIYASKSFCETIPKIGSILAYLNSALNPYLYSFLGTNFSKRWKLLKRSRGIQQFVSLAARRHDSSSSHRGESHKTGRSGNFLTPNQYQMSEKNSMQRPTQITGLAKDIESSQVSPSMHNYSQYGNKRLRPQSDIESSKLSQNSYSSVN